MEATAVCSTQHLYQLATQYHNPVTVIKATALCSTQHLYQLATLYHNPLTVKKQLQSEAHNIYTN